VIVRKKVKIRGLNHVTVRLEDLYHYTFQPTVQSRSSSVVVLVPSRIQQVRNSNWHMYWLMCPQQVRNTLQQGHNNNWRENEKENDLTWFLFDKVCPTWPSFFLKSLFFFIKVVDPITYVFLGQHMSKKVIRLETLNICQIIFICCLSPTCGQVLGGWFD
jgi:hypothetical protein